MQYLWPPDSLKHLLTFSISLQSITDLYNKPSRPISGFRGCLKSVSVCWPSLSYKSPFYQYKQHISDRSICQRYIQLRQNPDPTTNCSTKDKVKFNILFKNLHIPKAQQTHKYSVSKNLPNLSTTDSWTFQT